MTKEAQLWREWGRGAERNRFFFLCLQLSTTPLITELRNKMTDRLELFRPQNKSFVWWNLCDPIEEDQAARATACGFLAAMADSE